MTLLFAVIAIPGIAAVLLRWSSAALVVARYSLERFVAGQIADSRAQRGDISGMSEADNIRRKSRAAQRRALGLLLLWSAALVVPIVLPGTFIIYILYGLLWLLPRPKTGTVVQ